MGNPLSLFGSSTNVPDPIQNKKEQKEEEVIDPAIVRERRFTKFSKIQEESRY